jgi:glycerate 2-kinase
MRVVLAPTRFSTGPGPDAGSDLGAAQVAAAMAEGWASAAPGDDLTVRPMNDGGSGFVEAIQATVGGELWPVTVSGPLGEPVPAAVLIAGDTAYVEAAEAVGRHLLPAQSRDPTRTTSYGVGQLVSSAVEGGARRVVVGVGGTVTNDGGAGLLAALGAGPADLLGRGGLALAALPEHALSDLAGARSRLAGVELVLAAATDVALLGFHGTSATYAEAKGAGPEQAQQLEAALGHFADLATRGLVAGRPLLGRGPAAQAGAGSGGGIGFGLLLLGASYISGVRAVAGATGLAEAVAGSDLVLTGEGIFDWESLRGGVVAEVSALGLEAGVPVVVVAGQVLVGRRESMTLGLAGSYAIAARPEELAEALSDPVAAVRDRTARVARTWSRN